MRAVLVVNPNATTTTVRVRDILVRALRSQLDLEVCYTEKRGHAAEIAADAVRDGIDLLVTLGGDGTVNEAINGLLDADPGPAAGGADRRPAVAVVPGGSTNVFARAVGLPRDWAEGTGLILEALREGRTRTVSLGRADERYFTFCAGLGLDAEVMGRAERARERGATASFGLFLRSTAQQYVLGPARRGQTSITLDRPGSEPETGLATVAVQNTSPWTYIGDRPIVGCPDASFETGLDVLCLRDLSPLPTALNATRMVTGRRPGGKHVLNLHDLAGFTLTAPTPVAFQIDGDYLGERTSVEFTAVPDALRVVC